MEIELQPGLADEWNADSLALLSSKGAAQEVKEMVERLMLLNLDELDLTENKRRSLDLLQSSVKASREIIEHLRNSCKRHLTTEGGSLEMGQKYFDVIKASRCNIDLALQRIHFLGDKTFLLDTILPLESIDFYFEYHLQEHCDFDIVGFFQRSTNDWITDVQPKLLRFLDQKRWTKFYSQFCVRDLDELKVLVEFTKQHLPFQYKQPKFKRAVIDQLVFKIQSPLCKEILELLPPMTEEDMVWFDARTYYPQSLTNADVKARMKSLIEARGKAFAENKLTLTLDQLCQDVQSVEFRMTGELKPYVDAFQRHFKTQAFYDVHPSLMNMNKLVKAFAPYFQAQIKLLWEDDLLLYNEMLSLFLIQIPVSCVSDLAALCPCCEKSFAECLLDFEGIVELIPITAENEKKLVRCLILAKLPQLEENWGINKEEEEVQEMIEDDGTELGYFSTEDEESDSDKNL